MRGSPRILWTMVQIRRVQEQPDVDEAALPRELQAREWLHFLKTAHSRRAEAARARKKNSLLGLSRQSRDPEYGSVSVPLTPVARPVEEAPSEAGSATAAALKFERQAEERVPRGTSTPSAPPLSQFA